MSTTNKHLSAQPLSIVRARRGDMHDIAAIIRSSAHWYEAFIAADDVGEHRVDRAWQVKNFRRREFFLASTTSGRVGTISVQSLGEFAYLGYIYLDIEQVGRGYAKQLLDFACTRARQMSKRGLALIAHPKAVWATKAYKRYGFSRVARTKQEVLAWQEGALVPYYEQGFELYTLPLASDVASEVSNHSQTI